MSFLPRLLVLFVSLFAFLAPAIAAEVQVKGYTRKDGTVVAPYTRTAPNSTKTDNYSTKGNVNPNTGKAGTQAGDAPAASQTPPAPAQVAPAPRQTAAAGASAPAGNLAAWSKLRLTMTQAEVGALLGQPNAKTATKWIYAAGGAIQFDPAGTVTGMTLPAGTPVTPEPATPAPAVVAAPGSSKSPEPAVALRPGVQASAAEQAQAEALLRAGWTYAMPAPKSAQAAWGNKDGRTTWFKGWWTNEKTGEKSAGEPVQQGDGFRANGEVAPGAWSNGGSPAVSKVQWLASRVGGPAPEAVR